MLPHSKSPQLFDATSSPPRDSGMDSDGAQECPICGEPLSLLAGGAPILAICASCRQPVHEGCLHAALALDSRCALCRAELADVGYTVGEGDLQRPKNRRLQESLEPGGPANAWVRSLLADMRVIVDAVTLLIRRVEALQQQQQLQP